MEPKEKKQKQKVALTERKIQALAPEATPYNVMDSETRGFGVRVQPTGAKSFIMYRRFPGSTLPVRRLIGHCGEIKLSQARGIADTWLAAIRKGIDPARAAELEKKANIEAEARRITNTIGSVLESYLLAKAGLRSVNKLGRDLKRTLKPWYSRSIEDVAEADIEDLINRLKAEGKRSQARYVYGLLDGFFGWAVKKRKLSASPCALIDKKELIGVPVERKRVLNDSEIRAYWRASTQLGYPVGSFYRMLLLTGLRRAEVADAQVEEIDLDRKRWIIPAERMKNKAEHLVPIAQAIESALRELPSHADGPFLFSTTGAAPVSDFARMKLQLDELMRADLEAQGIAFEPFVVHDTRRTVRTRLGSLRVPLDIRERVLAHARPRLERIYDVHEYEDEKAEALMTWHRSLSGIIEGNVINFRKRS